MFSGNVAFQDNVNEEELRNNQKQIKPELVAEILQYKKFEEETIQKINQSKKLLREEERYVLCQAEKIKEIDAFLQTSSNALEQKAYERWQLTQNLSNVRYLCQVVNVYSEKTDDILNCCARGVVEYEEQMSNLQNRLEECKTIIKSKWDAQKHILKELEVGIAQNEEQFESEKESLVKMIAEWKGKTRNEIDSSLDYCSRLGECDKRRNQILEQITITMAENTDLYNVLSGKQERKQFVLDAVENNRQRYNAEIKEIESITEDVRNKLQQITEENEIFDKELEERSAINEEVLSKIAEYSSQFDYYKQKYSEIVNEEKQLEKQLTRQYNEATGKTQQLTDGFTTMEQKFLDDKEISSQIELEIIKMTEEIQHGHVNVENLKSEILKIKSINEIKARDISEKKASINITTTNIIDISNELIGIPKKLIEKEVKKSQKIMKITDEIHELQKQIKGIKEDENVKLNIIREGMESYKIRVQDDLRKQEEKAKDAAKLRILLDKIKIDHNSVISNTKQLENDLQGVVLEHDILLNKIEAFERRESNVNEERDAKVFEKPYPHRKRDVDETSDSSFEGAISVQEHIKRQKLIAQKRSAKRTNKKD